MARRAPAVERCVAVLNHLASDPGESYTLSEIARDLDLNKATAHSLLMTLVDASYLIRDPNDKSYSLGPALIGVGNAALTAYPAARLAGGAMEALTEEFDLECVASAAIGDEIVILASAGSPQPLGINIQPGQRLPLVPPLGTVFVAWADAETIDRWLSKVGSDADEADLDRYRQVLETVRERGYSVGLGGEGQQQLVETLAEAGHGTAPAGEPEREEYALIELAEAPTYRINHIGAPVFGPDDEVALALFLIGFRGQIAAEEVPRYAERLREAAERITAALRGGGLGR